MKKTKLTQQVLMALLLGSSLLPGSMAQAAELTVTTDQSGNISLPGSGNTLTIESGTIDGYAYGGFLDTGDVTGNTVTMKDGTVNKWIYGGYAPTGNATGNTVTMNGGTVSNWIGGGGVEDGNAMGNTVTMNGGTVEKYLDGGNTTTGNAAGNTVTVNAGTITVFIAGGDVDVTGNASGNMVTINGGTLAGIYGGYVHGTGDASGNTVTITGGTVTGTINGGWTENGSASNNIVNLYGGDLTQAKIYGGDTLSGSSTGNTLNVYAPLTVKKIYCFQNYNFYIPASLTGTAALLTVSGAADMADLNDTTVSSIVIAGSSAYKTGDTITLISAGNLVSTTGSSLSTPSVTARKGLSTYYTALLNVTYDAGTLTATLGEATLNPKVKALSETQAGMLAGLNTGSDLAAGSGLENALVAAGSGNGQAVGFVGTSAGQQTISTGSEVDGRGFSLMAGAAATRRIAAGRLTTGVFGEAGWGSFTTTNDIDGASVNADGHSNYKGGGILARLDRSDGIYYEGSLHAGHMDSTYASSDVTDYLGNGTSYDVGSPYYSAHMGLGRVWQLGAKNQVDVYGKYLWSYVPSRSVTVAEDVFDFASVASNRLRLGARWTKRCDDGSVYAGIAAEREFSGNQHATAAGLDIPAPSLSGTTGIVELGWRVPQSAGQPVAVNFGLTGLFGKRQGIAGGLTFNWGW